MAKQHWLVKSEPESYSWAQFVADGGTAWTGVRNFAARNHLRAMRPGDAVLFYHSVSEKQVVGLASVSRAAYADPTAKEGDWAAVDLKPVSQFTRPVTLAQLKSDPVFEELALLRQTRLSVVPVTAAQFKRVTELAGGAASV